MHDAFGSQPTSRRATAAGEVCIPAAVATDRHLNLAPKLAYGWLWNLAGLQPGTLHVDKIDLARGVGKKDARSAMEWCDSLTTAGLIDIDQVDAGVIVLYIYSPDAIGQRRPLTPPPPDPQHSFLPDEESEAVPPTLADGVAGGERRAGLPATGIGAHGSPHESPPDSTISFQEKQIEAAVLQRLIAAGVELPDSFATGIGAHGSPARGLRNVFDVTLPSTSRSTLDADVDERIDSGRDAAHPPDQRPAGRDFSKSEIRDLCIEIERRLGQGHGTFKHLVKLAAYCVVVGPLEHARFNEMLGGACRRAQPRQRGQYFIGGLKNMIAEHSIDEFHADLGTFDPQQRAPSGHLKNLPYKRIITAAIKAQHDDIERVEKPK